MKRIAFVLICSLMATLGFAQDDTAEIKTLVGKGTKLGGFMGITTKFSEVNNTKALLVGGSMGALFNDNIMLGFGGYGITSTVEFTGVNTQGVPNQPVYLYGGYGGLILGYKLFPNEIIHVSFPVLIGAGGFDVSDAESNDLNTIYENHTVDNSAAFVVEPAVEAEINVTKFFRIAIGGSYRLVQGTNFPISNLSDNDLSNWSGHMSLKFGKFW